MPVTRLSDAFVYDVYMSYSTVNSPERTALWESGAVANSELLNSIARGPGKMVEAPFWNDLNADLEPDYTNDDPADMAVPDKITSGNMVARKAFQHKAWSSMDLVAELSGSNPMERIRDRFGTYWTRRWQRRLIAMIEGVIADNIANDDGDMGIDISATGDGTFSAAGFDAASYTLGDATGNLAIMVVHSKVMQRMAANDEVVYVADSDGRLTIPTYRGVRVTMDDAMPKSGTGEDTIYTSAIFGTGAIGFGGVEGQMIGYGEGMPMVPAYTDRIELAGNGGGQEIIGERNTWMLHPFGFSWVEPQSGSGNELTEFSPTVAELREAVYWNRVVDRKQVPFAWIKSKA